MTNEYSVEEMQNVWFKKTVNFVILEVEEFFFHEPFVIYARGKFSHSMRHVVDDLSNDIISQKKSVLAKLFERKLYSVGIVIYDL